MLTELRLAFRNCFRRPVLAGAVILPIALAIALNSALFSVLDGLLFRPLPFDRPSALVAIDYRRIDGRPPELMYLPTLSPEREALRQRVEETLSASAQAGFVTHFQVDRLRDAGLQVMAVDSNFFPLLGLSPILGTGFSLDDERSPGARSLDSIEPLPVLLGHTLWQRLYGGDPNVLGVHELAGRTVRIVGVMGPGVKFPGETNIWTPVSSERDRVPAYGRLREGTTVEQFASRFPELDVRPLREAVRPGDSRAIVVLFTAAGLLLLVAWVQVAALIFSGAVTRLQEIGVRLALGAGRGRLVRQFAVENALLAGGAFALAWLVAPPLTTFIVNTLPAELTQGQYLAPDVRTFLFTAAVSVAGLALLTLLPVDLVRRASPLRLLSGHVGGSPLQAERVRQGLLIAQMTLTVVLLYVAGLAVHSFARVTTLDYGFDVENVLIFSPGAVAGGAGSGRPIAEFTANMAERLRQLDGIAEELRSLPGIVGAEQFRIVPLERRPPNEYEVTALAGQPVVPRIPVQTISAGPRFLEALGLELVAGYSFDDPAYASRRDVAVINETLARQLGRGPDVGPVPLTRQVLERRITTSGRERLEVIGIVRDFVQRSPGEPTVGQIFAPIYMVPGMTLAVRATPPVEEALPAVRATVERTFGDLPARHFGFLRDELRETLVPYRGQSMLLSLIAAFCLPLAAAGLAGALMYFVRVRTRETAIRMALGAEPSAVRRGVVTRAMMPVAAGIVLGIGLGVAAGRVVASQLFHVQAVDAVTIVAVCAVLFGLAWLAALIPARHACRIDPAAALRDA
jgi:putative ABC transport system permease protein